MLDIKKEGIGAGLKTHLMSEYQCATDYFTNWSHLRLLDVKLDGNVKLNIISSLLGNGLPFLMDFGWILFYFPSLESLSKMYDVGFSKIRFLIKN